MKCLFLDLASHTALLAAVTDDAVKASESVQARIGDHELLPLIEKVVADASWSYADLEGIACVVGPGGFTSLRVAVTCANTFADQLSIPSAGIHLSDLYRARAREDDIYWMHSTKKDQLFIRGGQWDEPTLLSLDEIPDGKWMGELIDEHREIVDSDPVDLLSRKDVLPGLLATQTFDTEILHPWYGRGW